MSVNKTMTVKDWPEDERPRERLLKYGVDVLSDAQLLAIIIRNGRGGRSAVDLGIELLEKFGSLEGIGHAGINEIRGKNGVKGIGLPRSRRSRPRSNWGGDTRSRACPERRSAQAGTLSRIISRE
jgi:hypothetical protein